jgi:excinuclease ABC subunit B
MNVEKEEKPVFNVSQVPKDELSRLVRELEKKMDLAASNLEFERAAALRDQITEIRAEIEKDKFKKKLEKQ